MTNREIDICVCTFRRPHIVQTLNSLAAMNTNADWSLRAIVADNDEIPSTKETIEAVAKNFPFPLIYIHAPARNISIARNACLDNAKAPLVAFIDDDEIVDESWLIEIVKRLDETKADAVIGPVKAIYEDNCPDWVRKGDYLSREAVYVNGEICTGYTANVLFDQTSMPFKGQRFLIELGQTGGEDSAFLKSAYQKGAKIEYAPNALITEVIPDERTKFMWLARRRFREGQTHGMMMNESSANGFFSLFKNIVKAAGKSLVCFAIAPFFIFKRHKFNFWIFRGCMHAGAVSYLFGRPTLILYGQQNNSTAKG